MSDIWAVKMRMEFIYGIKTGPNAADIIITSKENAEAAVEGGVRKLNPDQQRYGAWIPVHPPVEHTNNIHQDSFGDDFLVGDYVLSKNGGDEYTFFQILKLKPQRISCMQLNSGSISDKHPNKMVRLFMLDD
jgi:hypothetical protein